MADPHEDKLSEIEMLTESMYGRLRLIAQRKLRFERADHTLQATALANEAYLRLQRSNCENGWRGRDHFLAAAAEVMRRILVDHARSRLTQKRGGQLEREYAHHLQVELPLSPADLLAVHEALDQLVAEDPLAAELVKLRFFVGLSHIDAVRHLGLNKSKGDRVWAYAKARLFVLIQGLGKEK